MCNIDSYITVLFFCSTWLLLFRGSAQPTRWLFGTLSVCLTVIERLGCNKRHELRTNSSDLTGIASLGIRSRASVWCIAFSKLFICQNARFSLSLCLSPLSILLRMSRVFVVELRWMEKEIKCRHFYGSFGILWIPLTSSTASGTSACSQWVPYRMKKGKRKIN